MLFEVPRRLVGVFAVVVVVVEPVFAPDRLSDLAFVSFITLDIPCRSLVTSLVLFVFVAFSTFTMCSHMALVFLKRGISKFKIRIFNSDAIDTNKKYRLSHLL